MFQVGMRECVAGDLVPISIQVSELSPGHVRRVTDHAAVDEEGGMHAMSREDRTCRILVGDSVVELDRNTVCPAACDGVAENPASATMNMPITKIVNPFLVFFLDANIADPFPF